jgi:hypothetical protein
MYVGRTTLPPSVSRLCRKFGILLAALGPRIYSASYRNEYQKQNNNISGLERGRCVGLTNLPPSVNRLSRQCRTLNISNRYRPSRPDVRIALLLPSSIILTIGLRRFLFAEILRGLIWSDVDRSHLCLPQRSFRFLPPRTSGGEGRANARDSAILARQLSWQEPEAR